MQFFKTKAQRIHTAKIFYDLAKINYAVLILTPFASDKINVLRIIVGVLLVLFFGMRVIYSIGR